MIIKIADMAKLIRSTEAGSVNLVTKTRNAPISITFVKYENIARAIVAIGSKLRDSRATNRCTLKKIITVTEASSAPSNPDLPLAIVIIITKITEVINAGLIAPFHNLVSLWCLSATLNLNFSLVSFNN